MIAPLRPPHANNPLVSFVIPCYNAERWISHAILSCLEQTYRPIEIIVIDDGSTDRSRDILASYSRVITWETGPNRGGNVARNRGLALAQGKYVQFLDADDYLLPDKIATQVAVLEATGADGVWGDKIWHHLNEQWQLGQQQVRQAPAAPDTLEALLGGLNIQTATVLLRRQAILAVGGWDETLTSGQETDLLLRMLIAGSQLHYVAGIGAVIRRMPGSVSSKPIRARINNQRIRERALYLLERTQRLTPAYQRAAAQTYFTLAQHAFANGEPARVYHELLHKAYALDPAFHPRQHSRRPSEIYCRMYDWCGFAIAETLLHLRRNSQRKLRTILRQI